MREALLTCACHTQWRLNTDGQFLLVGRQPPCEACRRLYDLNQRPAPPVRETVEVVGVTANAQQVGGEHYRTRVIQPWDFVAANGLGFFEGNVVKYVTRWPDKGGLDDLRKARHYLDKLIEVVTAQGAP